MSLRQEQKNERLGETRKNKESLGGYDMKIIEYNGYKDIIVEFQDKHKAKIHTTYQHFEKGDVKNPCYPSVYGVGYIGEGKYKVSVNGKMTKAYRYWNDMLKRCYDPYYLNKKPTYRDCFICDEWLNFQNFAEWWEENIYNCNNERIVLDKDILVKGNKIYSPETCILVPERINSLFTKCDRKRGKYPIGTHKYIDKRYGKEYIIAQCNTLEKNEYLGCFPLDKPFQAFYSYKIFKENYIKKVANEYKDLIPKKLYDALYRYEVEIND